MTNVLAQLPYGFDSLILCVGLAALCQALFKRLWLSLAFGIADGAGALLGHCLTQVEPALPTVLQFSGPGLLAAYGILILTATASLRAIVASRFALAMLPVLLCLDNVYAGVEGQQGSILETVASMAAATTVMALIGFGIGTLLTARWPVLRRPLPGAGALVAALVMCLS